MNQTVQVYSTSKVFIIDSFIYSLTVLHFLFLYCFIPLKQHDPHFGAAVAFWHQANQRYSSPDNFIMLTTAQKCPFHAASN